MESVWKAVDAYTEEQFVGSDIALTSALAAADKAGMPAIAVSPAFGKMLSLLARSIGARRILEIGTLAGYSTIWLARALPKGGKLTSIELNPDHAKVAQQNIANAGLVDVVDFRVGRAADVLASMQPVDEGRFDFVFIDADKPGNPVYLDHALRLTRPGGLLVVDNVVRNGRVIDPESTDANVVGVRTMNDMIARIPNISAISIQTVGSKGYDGFTLILIDPS